MGKNKVIAVAFGKDPESEYKKNLSCLTPYLKGDVGILFTNESEKNILEFFKSLAIKDFTKTGVISD